MSMAPFLHYDWSTWRWVWHGWGIVNHLTHREVPLEGFGSAVCGVAAYLTRVGDVETVELV